MEITMKLKQLSKQILIATLILGSVAQLQAGFWHNVPIVNKFLRNSKIHTVIITGNHYKSRLLAELAQYYTRQPIILISPADKGKKGYDAFALMINNETAEIKLNDLVDFIDHLSPKNMIFLGNEKTMLPSKISKLFKNRYDKPITIDADDWQKNANALAEYMKCKKLPKEFKKQLLDLEKKIQLDKSANKIRQELKQEQAEKGFINEPILDDKVLTIHDNDLAPVIKDEPSESLDDVVLIPVDDKKKSNK